jgi:hypothetical protein
LKGRQGREPFAGFMKPSEGAKQQFYCDLFLGWDVCLRSVIAGEIMRFASRAGEESKSKK